MTISGGSAPGRRVATDEPETRVLHQDRVLHIFACDDVFVHRWSAAGDPHHMQLLIDHHVPYLEARAPEKTMTLAHVTLDGMFMPDARMRELIQRHVLAIDPHVSASALLLTSSGFAASVVRGILSAATMARRSKYPHRVIGDLDEATAWLVAQRSQPSKALPTPTAMSAWYRSMERRLGLT